MLFPFNRIHNVRSWHAAEWLPATGVAALYLLAIYGFTILFYFWFEVTKTTDSKIILTTNLLWIGSMSTAVSLCVIDLVLRNYPSRRTRLAIVAVVLTMFVLGAAFSSFTIGPEDALNIYLVITLWVFVKKPPVNAPE